MKKEINIKREILDLSGIKGIGRKWGVEIRRKEGEVSVILSIWDNGEQPSISSIIIIAAITYNLYLKETPHEIIRWFLTNKSRRGEYKEIAFEMKDGSLCNPRFL